MNVGSMKTVVPSRRGKTTIIRARCDEDLKASILHVAYLHRLDASDIVRMACAAYVQKFIQPLQING